jgi:4,5-dihydroxyphthalate decarboxylase
MSRLSISLACWNYDRTQALADGTIRPDGIDLNMQTLDVEETFFRMLRHREFDAAEMSLSSYCVSLGRPDPAFVAIPVFPSRLFRHSCIFVSAKSGIERPEDLVGKRIGVPEYQMTAPVWIRGILADEYGVDPASVTYHTGGEEQPGRDEAEARSAGALPSAADRSRPDAVADAGRWRDRRAAHRAHAQHVLQRAGQGPPPVPDFVPLEQDYYRRTGIFPIMHVIAIRRDVRKEPLDRAVVANGVRGGTGESL